MLYLTQESYKYIIVEFDSLLSIQHSNSRWSNTKVLDIEKHCYSIYGVDKHSFFLSTICHLSIVFKSLLISPSEMTLFLQLLKKKIMQYKDHTKDEIALILKQTSITILA